MTSMLSKLMRPGIFKHTKCRNDIYPKSELRRFEVPDDRIFWTIKYPEYTPPFFTASFTKNHSWADPDIKENKFKPKWNYLDGNVNRKSYCGNYDVIEGYPLNPFGRTGLKGRGILGRWGPNHAADPIVTRWKRNLTGEMAINPVTNKYEIVYKTLLIKLNKNGYIFRKIRKILQMIAIQRHDNNMWAIPGGMVDPGEKVSVTLKREFMEEALDNKGNRKKLDEFFSHGLEIFRGYVDDFRNTDNAWIETVAYNFHDENGDSVGAFDLSAGDDAKNVKWMDVDETKQLHASHSIMIEEVANIHNAHW